MSQMYPESTVMFSLDTNEYILQAKKAQINYIYIYIIYMGYNSTF